jgi:hypothetical protein
VVPPLDQSLLFSAAHFVFKMYSWLHLPHCTRSIKAALAWHREYWTCSPQRLLHHTKYARSREESRLRKNESRAVCSSNPSIPGSVHCTGIEFFTCRRLRRAYGRELVEGYYIQNLSFLRSTWNLNHRVIEVLRTASHQHGLAACTVYGDSTVCSCRHSKSSAWVRSMYCVWRQYCVQL